MSSTGSIRNLSLAALLLLLCSFCAATEPAAAPHNTSTSRLRVLEQGEQALFLRTWLTNQAQHSIDIQYFIWSTDNIGTLATERLLAAADRGVQVRVIVDDLMIDAEPRTLSLLATHPNVQIRIYNPQINVGASWTDRLWRVVTGFRAVNQRMHNKLVIFDRHTGITGGRNMADEYFDRHREYNFRDRDVVVSGDAVVAMNRSFEEYWHSPLSVPVRSLLEGDQDPPDGPAIQAWRDGLVAYVADRSHVNDEMLEAVATMEHEGPALIAGLSPGTAVFVSDPPGKNDGESGLAGGGPTTTSLIQLLQGARQRVVIQSPYLVMPEGGIKLFQDLVARGVDVSIQTNSLASTDNLQAFSGYYKQREQLLAAGIRVFEIKPHPQIRTRLFPRLTGPDAEQPIISLHAKTMVVDGRVSFVGSFNLDPRSANLNTETGIISHDPAIAAATESLIVEEMQPQNSWNAATDEPDQYASFGARFKVWLWSLLPMDAVL